ncbi:MAG: D-cysteine desulfhydrase family protein [Clostridiales bacterium]|jgi:D-cysteine desulfhydrase family pyridoxal phosphate-dependent enzyme|nr:D-cysteine desulfhydrase family protein [Clostridiales bacterium]
MAYRESLGFIRTPSPFEELKNIRTLTGASQRLFIKRDDLTDVGLGGNKNRKLEYVMKDALNNGADTIITSGGKQSNHCRQTLAYAAKLGLECHLFLDGEDDTPHQGNLFVFDIFGAKLHFAKDPKDLEDGIEKLATELAAKGKKPYIISFAGSSPLGALGYVDSAKEISEQAKLAGADVTDIFLATGTGGTQAGTLVGAKLYLPEARVHGVAVSRKREEQAPRISALANETAAFIGESFSFKTEEIIIHDEYYGEAYAVPTQAGNDAVRLLGRAEGILLDPVYTGKAFSALLDLLQKGKLLRSGDIVFIHTGGAPAIFDFTESFL